MSGVNSGVKELSRMPRVTGPLLAFNEQDI